MGHGTGTRRLAAHLNELGASNRILVLSQRFLGFIRGKPVAIRGRKCAAKGCFKKGFGDYHFFTALLSDMDLSNIDTREV